MPQQQHKFLKQLDTPKRELSGWWLERLSMMQIIGSSTILAEVLTGNVNGFTEGVAVTVAAATVIREGLYIKARIEEWRQSHSPKDEQAGALGLYRSGHEQEVTKPVSPELGQQAADIGQEVRQSMSSSPSGEERQYDGLRPINEKWDRSPQQFR